MNATPLRTSRGRLPLILCLLLLPLAGGLVWKLASSGKTPVAASVEAPEASLPAPEDTRLKVAREAKPDVARGLAEALGIEISSLQVAVNGTRVALRYRVVDSARATQLTNWLYEAYLLSPRGQRLSRPNIKTPTPLRRDSGQPPRADKVYSYFFPNPAHTVKSGDKVTLVIGDLRARDLVVR
jgi:hypothetical protein